MNALLKSQLMGSLTPGDHLDRAVALLAKAIHHLDHACVDSALGDLIESVKHQDQLGVICDKLRAIALDEPEPLSTTDVIDLLYSDTRSS